MYKFGERGRNQVGYTIVYLFNVLKMLICLLKQSNTFKIMRKNKWRKGSNHGWKELLEQVRLLALAEKRKSNSTGESQEQG